MALRQYPTLICALPRLPVDFEQPHVPISRPRLESYLRMLTEPDLEVVEALEGFWRWESRDGTNGGGGGDGGDGGGVADRGGRGGDGGHYGGAGGAGGADAARRYARLIGLIRDAQLLKCAHILADIRMLSAGVRAVVMGRDIDFAVGRWGAHVVRNRHVPGFGLSLRFPWLGEFKAMLEQKRYGEAERALCRVTWREMASIADHHFFDLLAVISYLVRWDLINSWAARDAEAGLNRFNMLVEEAIGEHV